MIDRAVAANPGWYMVPDYEFQFPFGLRGAPIEQATLRSAFACKFALLLGTDDVNYARLRNDPDALAQGKTRYDRGLFFFRAIEGHCRATWCALQLASAGGAGRRP